MSEWMGDVLIGAVMLLTVGGATTFFAVKRVRLNASAVMGLVFFAAMGVAMLGMAVAEHKQAVPEWSAVAGGEDVGRFFAGTWTYTEPVNSEIALVYGWQKWVIRDDGTVDIYKAEPRDDNWGKPSTLKYEAITGKYDDTGKRYYGLHPIGTTLKLIVAADDSAPLYDGGLVPVVMRRRDANPFSK